MIFTLISNMREETREVEVNSLEELKNLPERFAKHEDWQWEPPYELIIDFENMIIKVYDFYVE